MLLYLKKPLGFDIEEEFTEYINNFENFSNIKVD